MKKKNNKFDLFFDDSDHCRSRTKQEFRDSCNLNRLVERFGLNKVASYSLLKQATAKYFDASKFESYEDTLSKIADFDEYFFSLPSKIRHSLDNDPANLYNLIESNNIDVLTSLGFVSEKQAESPPQGEHKDSQSVDNQPTQGSEPDTA